MRIRALSLWLPPVVNGAVIIAGVFYWLALGLEQFRQEGTHEAFRSILFGAMAVVFLGVTAAGFVFLRRAAQGAADRWRTIVVIVAIALWGFALAALIAFATRGSGAYQRLVGDGWWITKMTVYFVLGVAMIGYIVLSNLRDTTLQMLTIVAIGIAVLAACLAGAAIATLLPPIVLAILGLALFGLLITFAWRYPEAARAVTVLAALAGTVIFLNELKGAPLWIFIFIATGTWVCTYVRFGDEDSNRESPGWMVGLQYVGWIVATAIEVRAFIS